MPAARAVPVRSVPLVPEYDLGWWHWDARCRGSLHFVVRRRRGHYEGVCGQRFAVGLRSEEETWLKVCQACLRLVT